MLSSKTCSLHQVSGEQPQKALMKGEFQFKELCSGFHLHLADVVELQRAQNSVELAPCLSLNILFEGRVDFSLGGGVYRLNSQTEGALCSAIILNRDEILTRYLRPNRRVKKLNISVSKAWLAARCKHPLECQQLEKLFGQHKAVHQWKASAELLEVASELMAGRNTLGLTQELKVEQKMVQLAGLCIDHLLHLTVEKQSHQPLAISKPLADSERLKQQIDSLVASHCSVSEVAASCHMSVSTLQRRFKASFGMTVNEYIRIRRLERAKSALAIEGLTIGEAAYLAGYNHSSNFIAAFKKQFSMTPSEMMKAHQS